MLSLLPKRAWCPNGDRTEQPDASEFEVPPEQPNEPTLLAPLLASLGGKASAHRDKVHRSTSGANIAKNIAEAGAWVKDSAAPPQPPAASLPSCAAAGSEGKKRHSIWLNVYDLDRVTSYTNLALRDANLGLHHCGVEVLGDELYFAWEDSNLTGVMQTRPRTHGVHVYKETLWMGDSPLDEAAIRAEIARLVREWPARSYHPIQRNCLTFAEELTRRLQVTQPFPDWVFGAVAVGRESPTLAYCADITWRQIRRCLATAPPVVSPSVTG